MAAEVITLTTAVIAGFAIGFAGALYYGGDLGDALLAGISAAALTYAGATLFPGADAGFGAFAKYGIQMGVIGGITTALQGGKFGHGFTVAGVSGFVGGKLIGGLKNSVGKALSSVILGGTLSKVTGGKFANGAATAAFAIIAYSTVSSASSSTAPADSGTSPTKTIDDFSKDQQADILKKINSLSADQRAGTYNSVKEAAAALHGNDALIAYAKELGIEFWSVIDGTSNAIKEVSTGFDSGHANGVYDGTFQRGDSVWHTHPSGGALHGRDFNSAWNVGARNIFASGTELTGISSSSAGINGAFKYYDRYKAFNGRITYNYETYSYGDWVSTPKTVIKPRY